MLDSKAHVCVTKQLSACHDMGIWLMSQSLGSSVFEITGSIRLQSPSCRYCQLTSYLYAVKLLSPMSPLYTASAVRTQLPAKSLALSLKIY